MARNRIHNFLAREREKMTERMWNEFVGNVLAMELDHVLEEPLDEIDAPEDWKQKQREAY